MDSFVCLACSLLHASDSCRDHVFGASLTKQSEKTSQNSRVVVKAHTGVCVWAGAIAEPPPRARER